MTFRLSTFLLVAALIGVAVGWLVERSYYASRLIDEAEREGAISSTLSGAFFSNMIYSQLDKLPETEFRDKRRALLINNVVFLWMNQDNAVERTVAETATRTVRKSQKTAVWREAGLALELLGVSNETEFAEKIHGAGFVEEWTESLLDENNELNDELAISVRTCLDFRNGEQRSFNPTRTVD